MTTVTTTVYDTASRQQVAVPDVPTVDIYVCGITPYDSMHMGHVALLMTYDVLARRLRHQGRAVRMVRNITDVDDPLLPKAQSLGIPYWDLVNREIDQMAKDTAALDLGVDDEPTASAYVTQMSEAVDELLRDGRAYRLGEHIYFDVSRDADYGSFSRYDRATMQELSGERGGDPEREGKRDPLDFVLWQPARDGEPDYDTVLGRGRPGWHIGCSVMSRATMGDHIHIHGGGDDLIFPHHESERAQNAALPGGSTVDVWMHGAPLAYQGEKMSKSLGNVVLARDLLREHDPRVIRLAVLAHYHHRHGSEWFDEHLAPAAQLFGRLSDAAARPGPDLTPFVERFEQRLDDDLDVPGAVAVLGEAVDAVLAHAGDGDVAGPALRDMAGQLGVRLD
ncbi:cysteine--tRNA ligase [Jatrophihabitans fulvus]